MSQKLSCLQAYKIMLRFFDTIYFQTYDEFLGDVLSEAVLYSANLGEKPRTMDPAIFGEWMGGLKKVMHDDTITYDVTQLNTQQAYAAAHQYLIIYCNMGAEPSVFTLRDLLNEDSDHSDVTRWLEIKWHQSVDYILQEVSREKIEHLFGDTTRLTHHESFFIMQMFLDNFCKRNNNQDLIKLVKNSRLRDKSDMYNGIPDIIEPKIWNVWQGAIGNAVEQEDDKILNLLSAYKAAPIFLENYFGDSRSNFFDKIIQKFEIDQDNKPVNFSYWSTWTSAAVKLNAQQMELMNNLISINTLISHDLAYEIIQEWLEYQKDLIGVNLVQQVIADKSGMQQAIDTIKQQPRSYLLLDDEVTILEVYHIMLKLLELQGVVISEFSIDAEQCNKPKDFVILLEWIRICEQVIKA